MKVLPIVQSGNKKEKKVALTFDDGPNPFATLHILDILKQADCKASFFLIGRWAEQHPDIVLRMRNEGHVIGGHTYWHGGDDGELPYHEFIKGNRVIEGITGEQIQFVRVPQYYYESIDNGILRTSELLEELYDRVSSHEIIVVGANVFAGDWEYTKPTEEILTDVVKTTSNGSIIGLHDGSEKEHELKDRAERTLQALPRVISGLRENGFEQVSLNEMNLVFSDKIIPNKNESS